MSGPVELERGGDGERINAADVLNGAAILVLAAFVAFFRRQLGDEALWLIGVFASLLLFIALSAAGHWVQQEKAEEVAKLLLGLLESPTR